MSLSEIQNDANALLDCEMMEMVLGGKDEACSFGACQFGCISSCQPCCKRGCNHTSKNTKHK